MTDKEKIRDEIKRQIAELTPTKEKIGIVGGMAVKRHLESILSFIDSMQEEPKECMYLKDNYTDEDRKVLCDGCEEDCKYNKREPVVPKVLEDMLNAKTAAESLGISQEEHDRIVDELIYGKEPELADVDDLPNKEEEPASEEWIEELTTKLDSLSKEEFERVWGKYGKEEKEEPVSEDLEEAADNALNNVLNTHDIVNIRSCLEMFRFGANWKQQQIMAKAIDGTAKPYYDEIWCNLFSSNLKDGDKVKVIVIKEE